MLPPFCIFPFQWATNTVLFLLQKVSPTPQGTFFSLFLPMSLYSPANFMTNLSFQAPFPQCHQASTAQEPGLKPRSNDNIPVLVQSPFITLTCACTRETYAQNYTPSPGLFLSPRVRQTTVCFKLLPQSPPLTNSLSFSSLLFNSHS